jgi:hypothetical protein
LFSTSLQSFVSENFITLDASFEENSDQPIDSFADLSCLNCFAVSGNCCPEKFGLNKVNFFYKFL